MIANPITTAYIGLGSNLGERAANIIGALSILSEEQGVTVGVVSQIIETEPVGGPEGQGNYFNCVAEVRCELGARDLLGLLQKVEKTMGRVRAEKWGPRTIDMDLLLFGMEIIDQPELRVPHPLMHQRMFVLEPLREIAPEAVHPLLRKTIRQLFDELQRS